MILNSSYSDYINYLPSPQLINVSQKKELIEIGKVVLDNEELVRKLVALGWDTLEVHDVKGFNGCKWALKNYAKIGGYIQ